MSSSTPKYSNSKKDIKSIAKSFITPCRQIGLSRRSLSKNSEIYSKQSAILVDSCNKNESVDNCTPKRKSVFCDDVKQKCTKKLNCTVVNSNREFNDEDDFRGFETPNKNVPKHKDIDNITRMKISLLLKKHGLSENFLHSNSDDPVNPVDYKNGDIDNQIVEVAARLEKKREIIQDLQVTGLNTLQHDLMELLDLTEKWRAGCQQALKELQMTYNNRGQSFSMSLLLNGIGIPYKLVKYSEDTSEFY